MRLLSLLFEALNYRSEEPGQEFAVEHNLLKTTSDKYKLEAQLPKNA